MAGEDYSVRELLIEMRGDVALIRQQNETQNEQFREHRQKHHELANTVQGLIAHKHEQIGFGKAVKAMYALCSLSGLSVVVIAVKALTH